MRVIGASWGRTGTTSAAAALDLLGFGPCLQMQTMWERPDLAGVWAGFYRGRPVDWLAALADFGSSVDWPGAWEWQAFADLWPDAMILLTVRDADSWHQSVLGSIHAWTAPGRDVGPPAVTALLAKVWDEHFGGWQGVYDRDRTIEAYEGHVDGVRRSCPRDRLVEWDVSAGWRDLCGRLGVDEPDQPVPHLNRRDR